jgi:hAT family C-terminal dimerisation region
MKVSRGTYPRITLMVREFLGVTSTSVPSESAFSKAGTTVDKRRARLGDEAVQAICELQSFLVFTKPRST